MTGCQLFWKTQRYAFCSSGSPFGGCYVMGLTCALKTTTVATPACMLSTVQECVTEYKLQRQRLTGATAMLHRLAERGARMQNNAQRTSKARKHLSRRIALQAHSCDGTTPPVATYQLIRCRAICVAGRARSNVDRSPSASIIMGVLTRSSYDALDLEQRKSTRRHRADEHGALSCLY